MGEGIDVARFERQLRERREYLDRALHRFEEELEEPAPSDAEDRASEREGDEVLESLGSSGLTEIRQIDAALKRVEEGEYGYCVKCGEPISEKRLEVVPHTAFCRDCA